MTLPNWDALPVRTKRSRKRLYAVLKGEYASLTAWKSLNINVKRSKIHLHNYIAGVLNLDTYEELDKQVTRSTRLWYNYVKANASGSSPSLVITVTDGTDPISGATVTIGTTEKTSGDNGKATFTGLSYGDYTVKVEKSGYDDAEELCKFRANRKNFTLPLSELPTLTVKVTDSATTPAAISGATVTIGTTSKTTNASGEATFKMDYGDYEASVSATGYTTKTTDIEFTSSKTSATVKLESSSQTGTVTVTVLKNSDDSPLEDAEVSICDDEQGTTTIAEGTTNSSGVCTLTEVPYDDYYLYVFLDGYDSYNEAFTVDGDETATIKLSTES